MRDIYEIGDVVKWSAGEDFGSGVVRRVEPASTPVTIAGVRVGGASARSARRFRLERVDGREVVKSRFKVTMG